ncbi:hypothetical protein UNH65_28210 [Chitinophaga sp. 180180018-2]|nr:hypothetical protein [Chitinophaga sp. 212800010-3]
MYNILPWINSRMIIGQVFAVWDEFLRSDSKDSLLKYLRLTFYMLFLIALHLNWQQLHK